MVTLYTDGASRGNPGPGGYAAILQYKGHKRELVGAFLHTTNNRMELLAIIVGLEALKKEQDVLVYSDSRYAVDAIMKGWLKKWVLTDFKKKKNRDLWSRFWQVFQRHRVSCTWVRGHAENVMNERCDFLASRAAKKGPWLIDEGYVNHYST